MSDSNSLSIILCTYNESNRIKQSLNEIKNTLKNWSVPHELIIIDNNSNDGTKEMIKDFKYRNSKIFINKKNLGKGGSIKKGISLSKSQYVMIFDPDLEYNPNDIIAMYDTIIRNKFDFIIGSRRLGRKFSLLEIIKDKNKGITYIINYAGVFFLTELINFLYGVKITDAASALKLFRKNFINKIKLNRNGFNLDFELVCKSAIHKGSIGEVAVDYFPRSKKEGKKIKALTDGFLSLICIIQDRFFSDVQK